MNHELPPPVTKNSSKADLWRELKCADDETSALMGQLSPLRDENERLHRDNAFLRHQLKMLRTVLEVEL